MKTCLFKPALVAALICGCHVAAALEFIPSVGAGLEYTDNAALTENNKDDDLIAVVFAGAHLGYDEGPLAADLSTSLVYQDYTQNTFGDKQYLTLGSSANWEMIRERLNWTVHDYYSQQRENSLDPDTPNNTQGTNVFSFGGTANLPVTARNSLIINPVYQDFYYEHDDTDNQRYGLNADWAYKLNQTHNLGLDTQAMRVDYDNENRNPNYDTAEAQATISGTGARLKYLIGVGETYVRRDDFDNLDGVVGRLNTTYQLTGHSSARLYTASELSDASRGLYESQRDPGTGDFNNEQISGDVLRNNIARFTYVREGETLDADIWTEFRDLNYKEESSDRTVRSVGGALTYRTTPQVSTGIYGRYKRTKEEDTNRLDKLYSVGGNISYRLARNLRTSLDIRYQNKDSTQRSSEYDEVSAFVSLVYGAQYPRLPNSKFRAPKQIN